jgi:hypothetical protein
MTEPAATPQPVYDSAYARLVDAPPEALEQDPQRYQPVGEQRVVMQDAAGKKYELPASSAQLALGQGLSFLPHEDAAREVQVEAWRKVNDSAATAATTSAMNQLAFGVPDIIRQHDQSASAEGERRAQAQHGTASFIGGAAGLAANVALTAGLGAEAQGAARGAQALDAAAPGIASRVFTRAALGAGEGAAYAAPQALAHAAYGDTHEAAESILWGAGLGGIIGLGSGALSEGVRAAKGAARDAMLAHGVLDEAGQVDHGRIRELMGTAAPEALQGKTRAELLAMKQGVTDAMSEHAATLDAAIAKAPPELGERLGIKPTELASKIQGDVMATRPALGTSMYTAEARELSSITDRIAAKGPEPVSFQSLDSLTGIKGLDSLLDKAPGELSGKEKIARQVAGIVESEKQRAMNEAFNALGLSTSYGDFLAQKEQLAQIGQALSLPPTTAASLLASKGVGLVSKGIAGAVGGIAGHAIGGPLGGIVGYGAVKGIATKLLDNAIGGKALALSTRALKAFTDRPETIGWLGSAFAKDTTQAAAKAFASIPSILTREAVAAKQASADPFKATLGPQANGLSKGQQFDRVAEALDNPQRVQSELEAQTHLYAKDPELSAAVQQAHERAVGYLAGAVPKNPNPAKPFETRPWAPTPEQIRGFGQRLEIVNNPMAVMEHIAAGDLTPAHVEALGAVYPTLRDRMVEQVAMMAHDPRLAGKVGAGAKLGLSMMTGINFDSTNYQQAYPPGGSAGPQGAPQAKKQKGPGSSRAHLKDTPGLATQTTRIEFKGQQVL